MPVAKPDGAALYAVEEAFFPPEVENLGLAAHDYPVNSCITAQLSNGFAAQHAALIRESGAGSGYEVFVLHGDANSRDIRIELSRISKLNLFAHVKQPVEALG